MYDVCKWFIKPMTARAGTAYAELLASSRLTSHLVKPQADVFVSYAWGYAWGDILSAIEAAGHASSFVWLDAFVVNQHHTLDKVLDDWLRTFQTGVEAIGRVLTILAPWDKPVYVSRAWCVFETLAALDANVERKVVFPPAEREKLAAVIRSAHVGVNALTQVFARINVARCQAASTTDRDAILARVGERTDVNDAVIGPLKDFYRSVMMEEVRDLKGETKQDAYAFNAVAALLKTLGNAKDALAWYERALAAHRHPNSGSSEADVGAALHSYAVCLSESGRFSDALRVGTEALHVREQALGSEHADTLVSRGARGRYLQQTSRFEEALPVLRDVATTSQRVLGDDDPITAIALNNVGDCLSAMGRIQDALDTFNQVLVMQTRLLGEDDPAVAIDLNNISTCHLQLGRFEDALACQSKALVIDKRVFGAEHPIVAVDLNNMGDTLRRLGRNAEALRTHYDALMIRRRTLGNDHFLVAHSLNNIVTTCVGFDDVDPANVLEMAREALAIHTRASGENNADVAADLGNMSFVFLWMGRHEEAVKHSRKALAILRCLFPGKDNALLVTALGNLASFLRNDDATLDEARELGREALAMSERVWGQDHPKTVSLKRKWPAA